MLIQGSMQQSAPDVKELTQLSVPHTRLSAHSSSPSQSPSNIPQGWELEQHDHVSPVQSHPVKLSKSKNRNVFVFAKNCYESQNISNFNVNAQLNIFFVCLKFSVLFDLISVRTKF